MPAPFRDTERSAVYFRGRGLRRHRQRDTSSLALLEAAPVNQEITMKFSTHIIHSKLAGLPGGRPNFVFLVLKFVLGASEEVPSKIIPDMLPAAVRGELCYLQTFSAEFVVGTLLPAIKRYAYFLPSYLHEHLTEDVHA